MYKKILALLLLTGGFVCLGNDSQEFVSYEKFGAKGDGKTDDQLAIAAAHDFANSAKLPVKVKKDAKYYIGGGDRVITIMTDTDFGNAQFTIDDRKVKNRRKPVFAVKSGKKSYRLRNLTSLYKYQKKLPVQIKGRSLLVLYDRSTKRFIRYGSNANNGSPQRDIIIVEKDGTISKDTPLAWDFKKINHCSVYPIDPEQLVIKGGIFTTIANAETGPHQYYSRNIHISRSNVLVSGLTHKVIEPQTQHSYPYSGFITIANAAFVTVQDTVFTGRKVYKAMKASGKLLTTGTYDISINSSSNIKFINCSQTNSIFDRQFWGIMGSNYCKNLEYDRCRLSRFDAHQGVYNATIRNSILGRSGISVTGYGKLLVENSTVYARYFIGLRNDYGAFWRGNIVIRNCTFIPNGGSRVSDLAIIGGNYKDFHNFGYVCHMPENILIDNFKIRDGKYIKKYRGPNILANFNNKFKSKNYKEPYPSVKPKNVTVRNISIASGKRLFLSENKYAFRTVKFINEDKDKAQKEARKQSQTGRFSKQKKQ